MIYMEPTQLGWEPLVTSWMESGLPDLVTAEHKELIRLLFEWLLTPTIHYVTKYCKRFVKCSPMHLTMQLLNLYKCMLHDLK